MSQLDAALQSFIAEKNHLAATAEELCLFMEHNNRPDLAREVQLLRETLANDSIKVAVLGEFKGGKSTLINAMLGKELLPSWTMECTATVTQVIYGLEPALYVHYADEKKQAEQKEVEELKKIATVYNPDFEDIAYLELRYPAELLKNGLVIVDTPGTNSAVKAREIIAKNYLKIADVAILVLNAQAMLKQSELEFIRNELVSKHYGTVFVVVNRCDQVEEKAQLANELERTLVKLKEFIPSLKKVYQLSALNALEGRIDNDLESVNCSGIEELESDLAVYVVEQGACDRLKKIKEHFRDIIADCVRDARMRLATLSLDKDKADAYARKEAELLNREAETLKRLKEEVSVGFAKMKNKLGDDIREKSEESRLRLEAIYCGTHAEKPDVTIIENRIKSDSSSWLSHAEQQWGSFYTDVMTYTANYLSNIDKELAGELSMDGNYSLGETTFSPVRVAVQIETKSKTEYNEQYQAKQSRNEISGLGIGMMLAGLIFGGWVGAGLAMLGGASLFGSSGSSDSDYMEKVHRPVVKQLSEFKLESLAGPYNKLVTEMIKHLNQVLDKSLEGLLKQVESISAMHHDSIKKRKNEIEYQRTETQLPKEVSRLQSVAASADTFLQKLG